MSDHEQADVIEPESASEPEQDQLEAELAPGTLAAIWENHRSLRRRVSAGSYLTEWPKNPKGQSTEGSLLWLLCRSTLWFWNPSLNGGALFSQPQKLCQ